jgi:hypothetical protein
MDEKVMEQVRALIPAVKALGGQDGGQDLQPSARQIRGTDAG